MTVAVLGLILLAAAGVLTAAVVTSNTGAIDTDLWGVTISGISVGVVFVAGMLTALLGVAALLLLTGGLRRGRRLRQERRVLRRENERLVQQVGSSGPEDRAVSERASGTGPDPAVRRTTAPAETTERDRTRLAEDGTERIVPPQPGETRRSATGMPVGGVHRPTGTSRASATSDSGS